MSTISSVGAVQQTTASTSGKANDLRQVDMDQFLQLLITELQNQDPLSPMDNSQILEQIGQIRQISATNQLSDTLGAVLTGQQMATASSLIGKRVSALADTGTTVEGVVDRVSIESDANDSSVRNLRVHVGEDSIRMENIRGIVNPTN